MFPNADKKSAEEIQYRFTRSKKAGCLCDIYDGELYQENASFFKEKFNVSFSLNYDGAPKSKFKSSGLQVWPVQMCINELPPSARYVISECTRN